MIVKIDRPIERQKYRKRSKVVHVYIWAAWKMEMLGKDWSLGNNYASAFAPHVLWEYRSHRDWCSSGELFKIYSHMRYTDACGLRCRVYNKIKTQTDLSPDFSVWGLGDI